MLVHVGMNEYTFRKAGGVVNRFTPRLLHELLMRPSDRRTIMACDDMICCLPFFRVRDLAERMHERRLLVGPPRTAPVQFVANQTCASTKPHSLSSYRAVPTCAGPGARQRHTTTRRRLAFPQSPPGPRGRGPTRPAGEASRGKQPRRPPACLPALLLPSRSPGAPPEKTRTTPRYPVWSTRSPPHARPAGGPSTTLASRRDTDTVPILRARRPHPPARDETTDYDDAVAPATGVGDTVSRHSPSPGATWPSAPSLTQGRGPARRQWTSPPDHSLSLKRSPRTRAPPPFSSASTLRV